jgi:hypothetical protein
VLFLLGMLVGFFGGHGALFFWAWRRFKSEEKKFLAHVARVRKFDPDRAALMVKAAGSALSSYRKERAF